MALRRIWKNLGVDRGLQGGPRVIGSQNVQWGPGPINPLPNPNNELIAPYLFPVQALNLKPKLSRSLAP